MECSVVYSSNPGAQRSHTFCTPAFGACSCDVALMRASEVAGDVVDQSSQRLKK